MTEQLRETLARAIWENMIGVEFPKSGTDDLRGIVAAADSVLAAIAAAGLVVVPREATEGMNLAGIDAITGAPTIPMPGSKRRRVVDLGAAADLCWQAMIEEALEGK